MAPTPGPRLTIGQAASYAGVTTRAVRHYHQLGLLAEPPRDRSGYRRYSARDVIDLIRIRALANAGVPLSRVGELLTADRDELAAAVAEIDQQLQAEIRRLEDHRAAVAQLATIDGLALPAEVVDYLDHLRDARLQRADGRDRTRRLADRQRPAPRRGRGVDRGEARVVRRSAVRRRLPRHSRPPSTGTPTTHDSRTSPTSSSPCSPEPSPSRAARPRSEIDDTTVAMLDAESIGLSPAWRRLGELLEERGWSGWTNVEPQMNAPTV